VNPGASGSLFYLSRDDQLIVKTVSTQEDLFLQQLLPAYYINQEQNPRTLLPKFFGLYCYRCQARDIRIVVMNNLLPTNYVMHQKYDLKGSTFKRKASKRECAKKSPTYKDLDFMKHYPEGISVEHNVYSAVMRTMICDCNFLETFHIMDYSLLLGIHNVDEEIRRHGEKNKEVEKPKSENVTFADDAPKPTPSKEPEPEPEPSSFTKAFAGIQIPPGGIPAVNDDGDRMFLFLGIIDILQNYNFKKKAEHAYKATVHDGNTVSVHRPPFYAMRFKDFMANKVFRDIDG